MRRGCRAGCGGRPVLSSAQTLPHHTRTPPITHTHLRTPQYREIARLNEKITGSAVNAEDNWHDDILSLSSKAKAIKAAKLAAAARAGAVSPTPAAEDGGGGADPSRSDGSKTGIRPSFFASNPLRSAAASSSSSSSAAAAATGR